MMTVCGAASTVTAQYTKALIRPQKRHNKIAMGTERSLPLKMKPAATEIKIDRPTATPTMMKGVASDTAHKTRLPGTALRPTTQTFVLVVMSSSSSSSSSAAPAAAASVASESSLPVAYQRRIDPPVHQGLQLSAIGFIRTPFPEKNGCPRQGQISHTRARLRLTVKQPEQYLDGLELYSHVHLIFHFHLNGPVLRPLPKIRPPLLDGRKVGALATRSPHRPNPIGLTIARITRIEHDTIHFEGVDLVNGTPIFDIKPYIPRFDAFPAAVVPAWVQDPPVKRVAVAIEPFADAQLRSIFDATPDFGAPTTLLDAKRHRTRLEFFHTYDELRLVIDEVLGEDTRSIGLRDRLNRGIEPNAQEPLFDGSLLPGWEPGQNRGVHGVSIDVLSLRIEFDHSTDPHTIRVIRIEDWRHLHDNWN
jgi:tRNA-Thr(GGU) m(6)t(6)A37 methyltransferase TsaA